MSIDPGSGLGSTGGVPDGLAAVQARIAEIVGAMGTGGSGSVSFASVLDDATSSTTDPSADPTDPSNAALTTTGSPLTSSTADYLAHSTAAATPVAAASASTGATAASAAPTGDWVNRLPAAARPYAGMIASAAQQAGVDPRLVAAIAWTESGFNAQAVSPAGAIGLMQLMPSTAAGLGVNAWDPAQSLVGGARFLGNLLRQFNGRTDLAVAGYNAGPGAVQRYGGVPPYGETQAYVRLVLGRLQQLGG